jgi:transposase-like protein
MVLTPVICSLRQDVLRISKCEDDREGEFHTQVFENYNRNAPEVALALTEMFVSGTSTRHPWGKWLKN